MGHLRVLITGAGGQLGRDLVRAFSEPHHDVIAATRAQLDLGDRDSVLGAITTTEPDAIIHAGAWTAVDACESDPDKAFRINALGTRHVQHGARIVGAHVFYVSTDFVFDGSQSSPIDEWSPTNPLSVYARSKLGGELEVDPGNTIIRTRGGTGFVKTMLRLAGERDELRVVADQVGSPTFTEDLALAIKRLVVGRLPGVFHVTNSGTATWFELAQATLEAAGLDPGRVTPIVTADHPSPARRPAYSVLDNAALRLQGLPLLPDWRDSLGRLVKELNS
ncbi:MAG TPA: dTDP-4-dehydrorhamnose reductase [Acidimicrobiales bacterium]|nr:dTDP-4-dehydrorhamnose reductase [Acidimicrobiales bacterium]